MAVVTTYKPPTLGSLGLTPNKVVVAPPTDPWTSQIANAKASLYTPQQLRTIANQQTSAQINAQLGASNASSKAEQAQFAELQNRAAGLAAALGVIGQPGAEATYNAYKGAADTMASLGGGLVGSVANDWTNQQADARRVVDQALGPGVGQVSSYDPAAAKTALQYGGVTLPGEGLANEALTTRAATEYGVAADKAQAALKVDDYIQQARDALNQRAAERASIIAQRPELFQSALQAQRQDNAATQSRIDNLVSSHATWKQNQEQIAADSLKAKRDWIVQQIAATHIDPRTGKPIPGFTFVPDPYNPGKQMLVTNAQAVQMRQFGIGIGGSRQSQAVNWTRTNGYKSDWKGNPVYGKDGKLQPSPGFRLKKDGSGVVPVKASSASASQLGSYSPSLSKQAGILVDGHGHHFKDATGKDIPYKASKNTKAPRTLSPSDLQKYTANIDAGLSAIKTGKDAQGNTYPVVTNRADAIAELEKRGYLSSPQVKRIAMRLLNKYYPPPGRTITVHSKGPFGVSATATP